MDISDCIVNNSLTIKAKPNAKKTKITKVENIKIHLDVAAPAEHNKANIEILKFFTKQLKKKVRIIKGKTSKEKVLKIEDY